MTSLILGESDCPANIIGYDRDTTISSATSFTSPPAGATGVVVQAETKDIRLTCDGTTPTSTTGLLLTAGDSIVLFGDIAKLKVIETAASAAVSLTYLSA